MRNPVVNIAEESQLPAESLATVKAGMRHHTESCVPWEEYLDLAIVARNEKGTLIGAAIGETGRCWLHISVVWVNEESRGIGIGRRLVDAMEAAAIRRGCRSAHLDTFSYQARPFYQKLGYEVFGTLEDFPPGHQRFYMSKRFPE